MKILLLFLALACLGCTKSNNDAQLPAATESGANTFGCKIDGALFIASGKASRGHPSGVTIHDFASPAWIVQGRVANKTIAMQFDYSSNPHVPGTFALANNYPSQGIYFNYLDGTVPTTSTEYDTDSIHNGSITITAYNGTFAAGTFAFDAINGDGKVVHVTEGRFDISF